MEKITNNIKLSLEDIENIKSADKLQISRIQKKFSIFFAIATLIGIASLASYLFMQIPGLFNARPFHMAAIFALMQYYSNSRLLKNTGKY